MTGYLNVNEPFLKNGWFFTGDAGYINKENHLVVIDRMSDMSYTADKLRYSPQYIENKLKLCSEKLSQIFRETDISPKYTLS